MIPFHFIFITLKQDYLHSIHFHSFILRIQSKLLNSIPFHSFLFLSIMIIPFHSILFSSLVNSQTKPSNFWLRLAVRVGSSTIDKRITKNSSIIEVTTFRCAIWIWSFNISTFVVAIRQGYWKHYCCGYC